MHDDQRSIERDFDYRTMKANTRVGLVAFAFLLAVLAFCATVVP